MSVVSLLGVRVLNNPAKFNEAYNFEITFECLESLQRDLEWKLTYVGSATSSEHDQELDSLLVGPIPVGVNKFIFEADPPDLRRIPTTEILGVTVILLTCSYDNREFVRVGYYVNNEYDSEELNAEPPAKLDIDRVRRNVLAEKPRVTRFAIKWDTEESAPAEYPPEQPEADILPDDGVGYGAEEVELEEQLKAELAAEESAAAKAEAEGAAAASSSNTHPANTIAQGDDSEMADMDVDESTNQHPSAGATAPTAGAGAHTTKEADEDDESDDAGSEDLEAESSGDDDDDDDDEEGEGKEGEGEPEDMEMADGEQGQGNNPQQQQRQQQRQQQQAEVMVH